MGFGADPKSKHNAHMSHNQWGVGLPLCARIPCSDLRSLIKHQSKLMWANNHKPPTWEWFITPIAEIGHGLWHCFTHIATNTSCWNIPLSK